MTDNIETVLLAEYDSRRDLYAAFTAKLQDLIQDLLHERGITVHSVTSRVKARDDFRQKLLRPGSKYETLADVTDIAGVRITTYFADDVDAVAELVKSEFTVDQKNSIDKRATLDPDRFGYLSPHHVVSLAPSRAELLEYRRFPALKAEIQTRSILQHAWAEIEHDLGYKTSLSVPQAIRRRFSRLAGLLELADQEFCAIRDELKRYEREVPQEIQRDPTAVRLDLASLTAYVTNSPLVTDTDQAIAALDAGTVSRDLKYLEFELAKYQILGIETVDQLNELLDLHRYEVVEFASLWLGPKRKRKRKFTVGISLFYLSHMLPAARKDAHLASQVLVAGRIAGDPKKHAERHIAIYQDLQRSL